MNQQVKIIPDRFEALYKRIRNSHPEKPIEILAVSKGQTLEAIHEAYELGHRYFGENRLQELEDKANRLSDLKDIKWSFIGQLQSKKVKRIVRVASEIHCLDNLKHAAIISETAHSLSRTPFPVFISVNADQEAQKSGVSFQELSCFYEELRKEYSDSLLIRGVMAIPSKEHQLWRSGAAIPEIYRQLREVSSQIGEGRLSLGMSGDLELAIAAGTDLIRVGTDLFGPRQER